MSTTSKALAEGSQPTYVPRLDGVRVLATEYRPVWLDQLADDVTIEGSAMDGVAQGAETVRSLVTYVRTLYDSQEFKLPPGRRSTSWSTTGPGATCCSCPG